MSVADPREPLVADRALWIQTWPASYGFAVLVVAVATGLEFTLSLIGPFHQPFVLFYPTVVIVAMVAGFWPGILATALAATSAGFFFLEPKNSFVIRTPEDLLGPFLFAIVGLSLTFLTSSRKRAEGALRASEDRYRDLVEHSEDLVCTHDLEGRLLSVNSAPARILGYTVEELLGIPMRELIIPEGREQFDAYLHRLRTRGGPESGLLCVLTKSGEVRTWEYRNTLRTEGVEKPVVRGMAHDVTERRQAELALEESQQQLRARAKEIETILDILPIPVIIAHDAQCRKMTANRAAYAHLGVQPGTDVSPTAQPEALRRRFLPDGVEIASELFPMQRAAATGSSVLGVETKLVLGDGTEKYELGNAAPIFDEDGNVKGAVGAALDITERILAEDALRGSEERLRLAQQVAEIGSFDRNLATGESRWTPQMETMYGLRPGTFPRTIEKFLELIHPDDRARVSEVVETSMKSGEGHGEWRVVWPNGEVRWITGRWRVFKNGGGKPVRAVGIDYDITERKRAEAALQASEESYRNFVAQSSEGIFREDTNPPIPIDAPEEELLRAVNGSQVAECNDALARMYGLSSAHELIGKRLADLLVPNDRRNLEFNRDYVRSGFRILDRETHETDVNGNVKVFLNSMIGVVIDGKLVSTWGIQRDVTEQKKAEEALRASEAAAKNKLLDEKDYLKSEIETELGFEKIIGQSPALREVLKKARVVAPTDSTVLLLGETGTGKELVARAVHALSPRQEKNFIKLNCAAVPTGLLESELFGHEKGAFTGAVSQKVGRLELADKGTLFLDEVGELPLEVQPKLLRVLQDREFERLGGIKTLRVDVRIISATNRDLRKDVAKKNFREDLFYRLNVFPIQLPPLRDRRADIPILIHHFVHRHATRMGKQIDTVPDETMEILQDWNWPGNVRELENMIERMVIMTKGRVLAPPPIELDGVLENAPDNLTEMEREHIIRILRETNGVLSGIDGAASRLGVKRTTLQSMLKRFGIEAEEYRRGAGTYSSE